MRNATTVPVPQPHDGIVPVASQLLDKSKGNNVIWANTSIKGVNHMEQRNHPRTKTEFRKLLEGTDGYDHVFEK